MSGTQRLARKKCENSAFYTYFSFLFSPFAVVDYYIITIISIILIYIYLYIYYFSCNDFKFDVECLCFIFSFFFYLLICEISTCLTCSSFPSASLRKLYLFYLLLEFRIKGKGERGRSFLRYPFMVFKS